MKDRKVVQIIENAKYILLLTHKNPDADTICSAIAFSLYLDKINKKYKLFNVDDIPKNFDFLKNYNKFKKTLPQKYDLVVFFDTANENRVGVDIDLDITSICFDHHISNQSFASCNFIDPSSDSTAKVLANFFIQNNIKIDKNMANALLAGIYDDSKGFSIDKVDGKTFEIVSLLIDNGASIDYITTNLYKRNSLAKYRLKTKVLNSLELYFEGKIGIIYVDTLWLEETGANIEDADEFVDEVLNLAIIEVAILLRIKDKKVRASFRSKNIDISDVASRLNGGGHKKAAGATIDTQDFNIAKIQILEQLKIEN